MNHNEVGRYWNENADAWTALSRAGCDIYRDGLNTPAFLELLPDVRGLQGLDIGCGEGHNTRLLAKRGASITAIDIAERFVGHAWQAEIEAPLGISYQVASAVQLPFADSTFDFLTAFMSLMDIPELERVLDECHRVLRPGGFLQFSISHPCFNPPHRKNKRNWAGKTYALEVGEYFRDANGAIEEWIFKAAPGALRGGYRPFRIPRFTRTLSDWLNLLIAAGFRIERLAEPRPNDEAVQRYPGLQDAQVAAYFLQVRARRE